jgi:ABC-2 type transport system ATP-binding protein
LSPAYKDEVLEVANVHKSYGAVPALGGVDLTVAAGEVLGLLGPNGAGKTTLVSIVAGLRRADAGVVRVCGIDVAKDPTAARRCTGLAPQELGIYPILTVRENLVFFGELAGLRRARLSRRIDEVADALELTGLLQRLARDLSGGEKRRVHTAMALMHRPQLLLLDEPTTGVDVSTRSRLLDVVRELANDGAAVCYSTHYLPEVEALGASVAILDSGRVVARGTVAELVQAHGRSAVELRFDGPPPALPLAYPQEVDGQCVRVALDAPTEQLPKLLTELGQAASDLRGVNVLTPSLEAVFIALTGRRYSQEEELPVQGAPRDVALA